MTGSLSDTGAVGVITSSNKQSSASAALELENAVDAHGGLLWGHIGPRLRASTVPRWPKVSMGTGGLHLRSEMGALA